MRKLITILLFSISLPRASSQVVFCPPGAEWHYSFNNQFFGSNQNERVKYVGDTIINGDTIKLISQLRYYNQCTNGSDGVHKTLIKQKGDTIFIKNKATKNTWQILYNFAATAGQAWTTTVSSFYNLSNAVTYTTTVDSIGFVSINNINLKRLFVKMNFPSNGPFIPTGQIVERIGVYSFMFYYKDPAASGGTECGFSKLLCYQDSTFGLKQFSDKSCDYTYTYYVGVQESNYQNHNIHLYPNPVKDFFEIRSEMELKKEAKLVIKDLYGRTVKRVGLSVLGSESSNVDIHELAAGVYLVSIFNDNELVFVSKLIKE